MGRIAARLLKGYFHAIGQQQKPRIKIDVAPESWFRSSEQPSISWSFASRKPASGAKDVRACWARIRRGPVERERSKKSCAFASSQKLWSINRSLRHVAETPGRSLSKPLI